MVVWFDSEYKKKEEGRGRKKLVSSRRSLVAQVLLVRYRFTIYLYCDERRTTNGNRRRASSVVLAGDWWRYEDGRCVCDTRSLLSTGCGGE